MKNISSVIVSSVLFLLILITPVIGSDWIEYDRDDNGNIILYKKGNIEENGRKYIRVWEKRIYSDKGREIFIQDRINEGMSPEGYDKLSNAQDLYKIDCKKKMMGLVSVVRYDKNDKVIHSHYIEEPEWSYIIPDSLMDALRKKVCE